MPPVEAVDDTTLTSCGQVLRLLHATAPNAPEAGAHRAGKVLVHGDFGPHNLLLGPGTCTVTAVVDWEFAHLGDLQHFFRAYGGEVPPWPVRKAAVLARCETLREFCHRWEPNGSGVRQWRERRTVTAAWEE